MTQCIAALQTYSITALHFLYSKHLHKRRLRPTPGHSRRFYCQVARSILDPISSLYKVSVFTQLSRLEASVLLSRAFQHPTERLSAESIHVLSKTKSNRARSTTTYSRHVPELIYALPRTINYRTRMDTGEDTAESTCTVNSASFAFQVVNNNCPINNTHSAKLRFKLITRKMDNSRDILLRAKSTYKINLK